MAPDRTILHHVESNYGVHTIINYRMSLYISRGSMKGEYTFYYDTFEFDECLLQISTKH